MTTVILLVFVIIALAFGLARACEWLDNRWPWRNL